MNSPETVVDNSVPFDVVVSLAAWIRQHVPVRFWSDPSSVLHFLLMKVADAERQPENVAHQVAAIDVYREAVVKANGIVAALNADPDCTAAGSNPGRAVSSAEDSSTTSAQSLPNASIQAGDQVDDDGDDNDELADDDESALAAELHARELSQRDPTTSASPRPSSLPQRHPPSLTAPAPSDSPTLETYQHLVREIEARVPPYDLSRISGPICGLRRAVSTFALDQRENGATRARDEYEPALKQWEELSRKYPPRVATVDVQSGAMPAPLAPSALPDATTSTTVTPTTSPTMLADSTPAHYLPDVADRVARQFTGPLHGTVSPAPVSSGPPSASLPAIAPSSLEPTPPRLRSAPASSASATSLTAAPEACNKLAPVEPPVARSTPAAVTETSDAAKATLLKAAPRMFAQAHVTSSIAAVLFDYIREHELYLGEGFPQMRPYACERLGLRSDGAYKDYARAGRAARELYPELADQIVAHVMTGGGLHVPPPPFGLALPPVSLLRALPAAVSRTNGADERAALLARVAAGDVTHKTLRELGRSSAPATNLEGQGAANSGSSSGDAPAAGRVRTPEDGNTTPRSPSQRGSKPEIFNDAPDLEQTAQDLRTVQAFFYKLAETYSENPGRDTYPVLPLLAGFVNQLGALLATLEERVIPQEVCPVCANNDVGCATCGGAGWVPRGGRHGADATATGPAPKDLPAAKVQRARSSGNIETPAAKEPLASPISANHDDHMVDQTVGNNAEKKTLKRAGNRAGRKAIRPKAAPIKRKATRARRSAPASHRTAPSTKAKTNKKKAK